MTRRLRAAAASALSLTLIAASADLDASRLFAQELRAAPAATAAPLTAPIALAAPSTPLAAAATPALAMPLSGPASARAVSVAPAAPALPAAAAVEASDAAPAPPSAAAVGEVAGFERSGGARAATPTPSGVDSPLSYKIRRLALATVAALTGGVYSLPQAGESLSARVISRAASRRAVLSDYDDTLASFNERLPQNMVEAVQALRASGKSFDVISDRGDEPRPGSLTVFDSLDTLPASARAGMFVAANSGGRVYLYGDDGVPVKVFEAPVMDEATKKLVAQAAAATKNRLGEVGAVMFAGDGKIPSESWTPYGYALMLQPGSSEAAVRATAAILQAEMNRRGLTIEAMPRFAKNPANPPYVTLSVITKAMAARYIADARGARARDVLILGDSHYAPQAPSRLKRLAALAARLAGGRMTALGNRTDANMERGVPGALTLSVGGTGDPRAKNLFVLAGRGPSQTLRALKSAASRPNDPSARARRREKLKRFADVAVTVGLLAAVAGAYATLIHAITDGVRGLEDQIQNLLRHPTDILGAGVLSGISLSKSKAPARPLSAAIPAGSLIESPAGSAFAAALAAARMMAARAGYDPDNLRVESASFLPSSSGERWDYRFVSPRQDYSKPPQLFQVVTRSADGATSVSETRELGVVRLFEAVRAGDFAALVKIAPLEALARAPQAEALSLEARWPDDGGPAEMWYALNAANGKVILSVNAATGETTIPDPYGRLKAIAAAAGLFGLVAAIYGALFYALGHAPAATNSVQIPPGWQGPVPNDVGGMFGGFLGAAGILGAARGRGKSARLLSDDQVRARAASVISYKGYPWSQTEYGAVYYPALERLKTDGATAEQLALFERLCAQAPIRGGRFNPWSGD